MKKSYSTKAYYNYARKLLEGDVAAGDENYAKVRSPQFNKLLTFAAGSGVGALAALSWLKREFFVDSWNSLSNFFQQEAAKAGTGGFWGTLWAGLKASMMKVVGWVGGIVKSVSDYVGGSQIGESGITYRGVVCMVILAAAVCGIIYKVYKVIKNRRQATESVSEYRLRQTRKIRKIFSEANMAFDSMNILSEGIEDEMGNPDPAMSVATATQPGVYSNLSPAEIEKFQAIQTSTVNRINGDIQKVNLSIARTKSEIAAAQRELAVISAQNHPDPEQMGQLQSKISQATNKLNSLTTTRTNLKAQKTSAEHIVSNAITNNSTIIKAQQQSMTMWESMKTWVGNNQLVVIVGVIVIVIAAFFGIKKYMEKRRAAAAATTESVRLRKSNRRLIYGY